MIRIEDWQIVHKEASILQELLNEWKLHYILEIVYINYDTLTLCFIAVIHRTPKTL